MDAESACSETLQVEPPSVGSWVGTHFIYILLIYASCHIICYKKVTKYGSTRMLQPQVFFLPRCISRCTMNIVVYVALQ